MFGPKKDTRAKRAFKKALLYSLLIFVLLVVGLFLWAIIMKFVNPVGGMNFNLNLTWLLFFGFVYAFAYFKDYLDEINEKLDRIEQKLNNK